MKSRRSKLKSAIAGSVAIARTNPNVALGIPCTTQWRGPLAYDISPIELLTVLRAPFQLSKRVAGEAAQFGRGGFEFLGVIGATRLECGKPAAEAGKLIRRQVGNSFGDF